MMYKCDFLLTVLSTDGKIYLRCSELLLFLEVGRREDDSARRTRLLICKSAEEKKKKCSSS